MVCTHVIPRLRIAALWPTWVFGKRPFFLKRIFMAKNAILMATIIRVNNSVFNIFAYIFGTKLLQKSEMRKEIVIELSYKGFSRASDYS